MFVANKGVLLNPFIVISYPYLGSNSPAQDPYLFKSNFIPNFGNRYNFIINQRN